MKRSGAPHRALVVGFGFMGAVHAANLVRSPNWELVGIVEKRPGDLFAGLETRGNLGARDFPVDVFRRTPVFDSIGAAAAATGAECAILAVPLPLHAPLTAEALEAGLHCLVEKPFAANVAEAEFLIDLARRRQRQLMVAHCVRFDPVWRHLSEAIAAGIYGPLRRLECRRIGGEPVWGSWRDPAVRKRSGGALFDLTIHDIDFVRSLGPIAGWEYLSGAGEYRELRLCSAAQSAEIRVNGGFLHSGTTFSAEYLAEFETASVRSHSFRPGSVLVGRDGTSETLELPGCPYRNELEYFGDCLQSGNGPARCTPEESLDVIALCTAIQTGEAS